MQPQARPCSPGSCLIPLEPRSAASHTSEAAWTCFKEAQLPLAPASLIKGSLYGIISRQLWPSRSMGEVDSRRL